MIMIHKGDKVLLTLRTPGPLGITEGMWKYQDKEFIVSRIKTITPDGKHRGGGRDVLRTGRMRIG